jgi:formiminotetrahydrofolate cyclodeaminase
MKVTQSYLKVLDPHDTSTGGGSASAIAGAMGGSLLGMVCLLCGKTKDTNAARFTNAAAQAQKLLGQLLQGGQADSLAFQGLRKAFKLPRETEVEQAQRSQAIQSAWVQAGRVPLENAAGCLQLLRLAADLKPLVKPQLLSDFNCAILLARAGMLGCLENVAINLPSIKDQPVASQISARARQLYQELASLEISAGRYVPPALFD